MTPKTIAAAAIVGTILAGSLAAPAAAADNPFAAKSQGRTCLKVAEADGKSGGATPQGGTASGDEKTSGGEKKPGQDQSGGDKGQGMKGGKCGEGKCGGAS